MSLLLTSTALVLAVLAVAWLLVRAQGLRKGHAFDWLALSVALLASAPLAVALTLLLIPFWRWLEASYGIESLGHSGPAEWCYVATFLVCLVALGFGRALFSRGRRG